MGMSAGPILTDDEHAAALREIEALWGKSQTASDNSKLDELARRVEAYEEVRWPLDDAFTR